MRTLDQIKELAEILAIAETATPDNTGFIIDEGTIIVSGVLNNPKVEAVLQVYLQVNKAAMIAGIVGKLRREIKESKKEYQEHLEKEKNELKGIAG